MRKLLGNVSDALVAGPLAFLGIIAAILLGLTYVAMGLLALGGFGWMVVSVIAWLNGVPDAPKMFLTALVVGMLAAAMITGLTSLLGGVGKSAIRLRRQFGPLRPEQGTNSVEPLRTVPPRRPLRRIVR